MKKIYYSFVLIATAALLALISGCNDNLQPQPNPEDPGDTYFFSIKATKANALTKALQDSGTTISATWSDGEYVDVYIGDEYLGKLNATASQAHPFGENLIKLEGYIKNTVVVGDDLTLKFKSDSYDNQDGTLEFIAANCDYATATIQVGSVDKVNKTATPSSDNVSFTNQQAIVKFTLMDDYANKINATTLSVMHGTSSITLPGIPADTYTTNGDGVVYVAIPGFDSETMSLEAVAGGKTYTSEKSGVSLTDGTFRRISVYMFNELTSPLTFEVINNNTVVYFSKRNNAPTCPVEYNLNHNGWIPYGSGVTLNSGDKIQFRGSNPTYANSDNDYNFFSLSDSCYVYGNIMSLVNGSSFASAVTLESAYTFCNLFQGQYSLGNAVTVNNGIKIKSHEKKSLVLPATTLTEGCYDRMFCGCSGLFIAPKLPAAQMATYCYKEMFRATGMHEVPTLNSDHLAKGCYWGMFRECNGLTSVPDKLLPAITLAESCYREMFNNCDNIVSVSNLELPATTMVENCYRSMFAGCDIFKDAPELSSTQLADSCYCAMFSYCTRMTKAPALPAQTLAKACYMSMFSHTHLSSSPVLNAPTLVESCYNNMFAYCEWLTSVTCMATDNSATNCTANWLDHVNTQAGGNTRTVTTKAGTIWPSNSADGIPTNWKHIEIASTPIFGGGWQWDD